MPKGKITSRSVNAFKGQVGKDVYLWDTEVKGFGLRVQPSGRRSYIYKFRTPDGRRRNRKIGAPETLTAEAARKTVQAMVSDVALGKTIVEDRPKTKAITMRKLCDMYLEDYARLHKKPRSVEDDSRYIEKEIKPLLGAKNLSDIRSKDIVRIHSSMSAKPVKANRLNPSDGSKPLHPNSANRDIGNLRKLFRVYWEYEGEESRENPFRNLRYTDNVYKEIPPFENEWVRTRFLKVEAFKGLNREATLLLYAMIETGCRPSELANLKAENIHLNNPVPYIEIKPTANRELKSNSASRTIPLVGVALQAMKMAPNGFPHYQNKEGLLSSSLLKTLRNRGLFPTKDHRIYSLRHSFEKRMLEAGIDHDLRCTLMGHSNSRPKYGDGGSLEYRRDELLKIVHPIEQNFIETLIDA